MTFEMSEDNYLQHYGILRRSGRYPWGSGGDFGTGPNKTSTQRSQTFLDHVATLRANGFTESQIAKSFKMSTTELRATRSIARAEKKASDVAMAQRLKDKGWSNVAIGKRMGDINESSVRALLAPGAQDKADQLHAIASMLKDNVDKKGFVDVGVEVERHIPIGTVSKDKLATAVSMLKSEGYEVHKVQVDQPGTMNKTTIKVLAPPGTTYKDIVQNKDKIRSLTDYSDDNGRTWSAILPPMPVSSKRVAVKYAEDGGGQADGVIYVRPGKNDLDLGGSSYAQVRIAVDGTHYLKGMAVYKDDLPKGVDLVFNTAKKKSELGSDKLAAMKPLKVVKETGQVDPENPFGSFVRQIGEKDASGRVTKLTSAMNLVNEQGDWQKWSKSLSSQVLSKQTPTLAKELLDARYSEKKAQLDEIMSLTNPAVRAKLLDSFASDADASAVHLKAAAMKGQASHVILPVSTMKETEVYAPNYKSGDRVVLIRYPHGGKFEIPELYVNNNHPEAKKLLGNAPDAIGISHKTAKRLSGADFDGDTVLVIPNNSGKIKSQPALERLKEFDPQHEYPGYEGMPKMSARTKGQQMGLVSNLITDMTIGGASNEELARAVSHSMVVIDAEKHNLNYKQSAIDHGIPQLMKKYQGRAGGGAATLISRATSRKDVIARKPRPASEGGPIDKATGKLMFVPKGPTWVDPKTGEVRSRTMRSTKLAETDDARTLISANNTKIEHVYAEHSNSMKALANAARRELVNTERTPWSDSAKKTYADQVRTLDAKLHVALKNSPLERQAIVLANTMIKARQDSNPDMDSAELKKIKGIALTTARARVGAKKERIEITDDEWKAIQAGAVSHNKLEKILNNTDVEKIKELATPRSHILMNPSNVSRAKSLLASGHTQAEVASALGVSLTTLKRGLE